MLWAAVFSLGCGYAAAKELNLPTQPTRQLVAEKKGVWPVEFGPRPETLQIAAPAIPPAFWTAAWTRTAQDFVRQAYVLMVVAQKSQDLIDQETDEVLVVLAGLNKLAQWACRFDQPGCEAAVRHVVTEGLGTALETAHENIPIVNVELARSALDRLANRATDDADFQRVTRAAKLRWRKTSSTARNFRTLQVVGSLALLHVLARVTGFEDTAVARGLTGGLLLSALGGVLDQALPLTTRFWWAQNRVGAAVDQCALALASQPAGEPYTWTGRAQFR